MTLPPLEPLGELEVPEWTEYTLPNGLTLIVVPRQSVPMVELRLWLPFGNAPLATAGLLGETLLSGTSTMSNVEIAARLQTAGGILAASVDSDRLMISGNALVTGLDRLLEVLAQVLTDATYPDEDVATERSRLAERIGMAQSQPAYLARRALQRRIYGEHPYAVLMPEPEQIRGVAPQELRELHSARLLPHGATLVLVGDVTPEAAVQQVSAVLAPWQGKAAPDPLPATPPLAPGRLVLADRADAVQSSLRIALPAVPRSHPDHAPLQLANLVFGGYFSSRWVENIREDKGYTYGAHATIQHSVAGSVLLVSADVATSVTAPAMLETWYELGRMAAAPPSAEEVAHARQFLLGGLQLRMATQATLATVISSYAGVGLRPDHMGKSAGQVAAATVEQVAAAAAQYLAPTRAIPLVLGDVATVESGLATLLPVEHDQP